jgi:2-polyprenyl-3-methyl-5-hydroxy-6-metoxy-1,4-benzoquinol methylase
MEKRLIDHYDTKYQYENDVQDVNDIITLVPYPANRYEACINYFPKYFNGGKILELGAGNGIVARSLIASGINFDSYTITEISDARLQILKKTFKDPAIKILKSDAESPIGLEEGEYDAVIMIALIEHLIDPISAMYKVRKLLKSGGFVYIDTPNIAKFTRRAKLLFGRFPATASINEGLTMYDGKPANLYDEGHLHYFTYRSISLMIMERCGFSKVIKIPYFSKMPLIPPRYGQWFANIWPEFFADVNLIAYY